MKRLQTTTFVLLLALPLAMSCATYHAWQKGRTAEKLNDWDKAVREYEKALEIDPDNNRLKIHLQRAKLSASRIHFEKGKSLRAAAATATGADQLRLAQLAATELELTVRLDPTNQYAAVELGKAVQLVQDLSRSQDRQSIDEVKRRAKQNISKAQPPTLNPASEEPITLLFPRETPVKEIYRALGNAFGINIMFDQAIKDDRIAIELRDVTAQQALERVMQAASHFYKVLDEKTIIVVPDNPQARRDYEDLVIRTFYLSNGDAEQVTNVVRTMIEARNVFPLKALNAITIRDTADKVRIAEKIIEANDKAKAEVVVEIELLQMDLNKTRDIGIAIAGGGPITPFSGVDKDGKRITFGGGTLGDIASVLGSLSDLRNNVSITIPTATYAFLKNIGNTELLANPQLRISEGEKATLHIGQRIPVPVTTFPTISTVPGQTAQQVTSFQYQDVGIKVSMEPRVHHNREVTLKMTIEVSNPGITVEFAGQKQPSFQTRTIESTIRLKDGETNFLAGLIQSNKEDSANQTPILGELPIIGKLFSSNHRAENRTDLILTMTPHIIRIPDITEDDLAPMWVGTTNNLTFRGLSPRVESPTPIDPFAQRAPQVDQFGNTPPPAAAPAPRPGVIPQGGTPPTDPFRPAPPPQPQPQSSNETRPETQTAALDAAAEAAPVLVPRLAPQPVTLTLEPGQERIWSVVGMDLDGMTTGGLLLHYDPRSLNVAEVRFGPALQIDPTAPPVATIDAAAGTIRITPSNGQPLRFASGGEVLALRVTGGAAGETFLVMASPNLRTAEGRPVVSAVAGGRARVE
ncbi:MAG TPA: secretin N-terminal domain-containing protein [Thermoanaerobaculia bacterium]|nr:secretin N-terminal domain-containing protein [Thermoanaerobaculia bacterium]